MDTVEIIDKVLKEKISADHVEIIDDSHLHRGHKAAGGGRPQVEEVTTRLK
jgi:BolA protein